jgi:dipeptidyl-peptidase 4
MKIKNSLSLCLSLFVILLVTTSFAQDSEPLTLERVFYSGEFRAQSAPSSTWYKDSEYLVTREKSATAAGRDFMLTSVKSDKKSVWIKAENFIPAGQTDPIGIEDYSLSKDWSKMLIFTDSKRVWRSNTKGNYWILDIKSGELRQLGKGLPESSLMFAKFSPDEQWVAYVSDFNLFKENLSTGKISQLTEDGNIDIINGTFDWVYEEEFSCRDGFRWSPDGKSIAFWQVDATNIRDFYMINNTDSLYPFVVPVQYPKVGEDPSRVRVAVVNASNGHRTWMDIPGDQIQNYIPRMQWVGDKLLVQQLNRHQNNLKFWSCDVATGKARLVHEETDAAYIEVMNNDFSTTRGATDDLELLVKSKELVHLSEKDGWKHLHAIKVDGSGSRCITNVEYDVASVYSVMVDKDLTYFSASPGNATQRYLYSSSLSGKGKAQRLTPKEFSGVNHYSISPNGKYAIHSHSSMTAPRSVRLISLPSHKVIPQKME